MSYLPPLCNYYFSTKDNGKLLRRHLSYSIIKVQIHFVSVLAPHDSFHLEIDSNPLDLGRYNTIPNIYKHSIYLSHSLIKVQINFVSVLAPHNSLHPKIVSIYIHVDLGRYNTIQNTYKHSIVDMTL